MLTDAFRRDFLPAAFKACPPSVYYTGLRPNPTLFRNPPSLLPKILKIQKLLIQGFRIVSQLHPTSSLFHIGGVICLVVQSCKMSKNLHESNLSNQILNRYICHICDILQLCGCQVKLAYLNFQSLTSKGRRKIPQTRK